MKIGVGIFTYLRSRHLVLVLEALRNNNVLPEIVYFFHDGYKKEEDKEEWYKVQRLIEDVDWCKKEIMVSDYNKGLAQSIRDGVSHILEACDAVVVLEDDCIPGREFYNFMSRCLKIYEDDNRIYSVSGYGWPFIKRNDERDCKDIYFTRRVSSWGWGTWKDKWNDFNQKGKEYYDHISDSEEFSYKLNIWGKDLGQMLHEALTGKIDSWAVFWAFYVLKENGLCIAPYESLIRNVGTDGDGTNCVRTDIYDVFLNDSRLEYNLTDEVIVEEDIETAFAEWFGGYTAINKDFSKEHILIYGLSGIFALNEKYINKKYYIDGFIDRSKHGYYGGKKILSIKEIINYPKIRILIMLSHIEESISVAHELIHEYGIEAGRIILLGINELMEDIM